MSQRSTPHTPSGKALSVSHAVGFVPRLCGLLTRPTLPVDHGLYFDKCNAVHTWGMRFPIDLVYLDEQGTVLQVVARVKPWRFSRHAAASAVLELASGSAQTHQITPGVSLCLH